MTMVQALGAGLVILALADVFLTVLYARSGTGLFTPTLQKTVWRLFKVAAPRKRMMRDKLLSFAGPSIMVLTALVWFLMLLIGFSLIVWSELGDAIQASRGPTPTDFAAAVYYSGFGLTTLGTGDIVPKTGLFRILIIVKAATGFSVLTLTLTYFMSVYSALVRRNTLANALDQLSGGTGDAAELVAGLGAGGSFAGARETLVMMATRVNDLLESHHSYPVIHYFRLPDERYAMARIALLTMDGAALLRTALGAEHRTISRSAAVQMLWGSGLSLLREAGQSFLAKGAEASAEACRDTAAEEQRFSAALARLKGEDIAVVADAREHRRAYIRARGEWFASTRAFAQSMAHSWDEIEPAARQNGKGQ